MIKEDPTLVHSEPDRSENAQGRQVSLDTLLRTLQTMDIPKTDRLPIKVGKHDAGVYIDPWGGASITVYYSDYSGGKSRQKAFRENFPLKGNPRIPRMRAETLFQSSLAEHPILPQEPRIYIQAIVDALKAKNMNGEYQPPVSEQKEERSFEDAAEQLRAWARERKAPRSAAVVAMDQQDIRKEVEDWKKEQAKRSSLSALDAEQQDVVERTVARADAANFLENLQQSLDAAKARRQRAATQADNVRRMEADIRPSSEELDAKLDAILDRVRGMRAARYNKKAVTSS